MRAMVYAAPLTLNVQDLPEPEPAPGEVVVNVKVAGICGSELEGIRSKSPFRVPPLVMGHEFGGTRVDDGRRVVVNPIVFCGCCDLCLRGSTNICRERAVIGIQRPGAFAERVCVPLRCLYPVPDDMTWAQVALVEPIANAVHAWRLVADQMPARVGVIGAGTIGLTCLLVSRRNGAEQVHVADLAADRLNAARRLGADAAGDRLPGEYDVIFDAVGSAGTRRLSVDLLRPGGTAVWLGLHEEDPGFAALAAIRAEKSVRGSFAYTDPDFRRAIAIAARVDTSWVTEYPLENGADVFVELMNGRTDVIKAHLVPA